jgi:lipopolysaccharide export system protein LptA
MKPIFLRVLPLWSSLFCLGAVTAAAQAPKPTPDAPKPPVHKPEQSILNRVKQDERSKKQISDSAEKLREAAKRTETGEKELKRINPKDLMEDPGKVIESMKDKLDPAALKELQEKAKEVLDSEDGKKLIEEIKKKANSSKPKTATTTPPGKFGPSTFDQVPLPVPAVTDVPQAKPRTPGAVVNGDSIIFPPSQDPANPERALPASDPRSRTYVIVGSAQVKTASLVLDADRIEFIKSQESGAEGIGGLGASPKKSPTKTKAIDPVNAGAAAQDEEKADPFEMIIATGRVNIVKIDKGKIVTGKGGSMIYRKKTGEMILTDWPEVQDGKNVLVARQKNAKIVLIPKGQPYSEGCELLTLDEAKSNGAAAKPAAPPRAQPVQ